MKKEIIITAKTVEEAMSEAYNKYSTEGDVTCEILEMPKKGFLGLGTIPAKIKAIIDDGVDETDISDILNDVKSMSTVTDRGGDGTPAEEKKPEKAKVEKTVKAEKKTEKSDKPQKAEKKPEPVKTVAPAIPAEESKKNKYSPVTDVEMQFAIDFVETVLRDLEIEAQAISVKDSDGDYVGINIIGENTGALIGHHGETLDAIQYLANLSASRRSPTPNREFLKITVDIENYRAKREETLRALARRMAAKAVKYKRNFVLEPMNPYERRIIHSEIQQIENVDTHSVGSDENRKVVVTYEGADKSERRNRQRRRRSSGAYNNAAPVVESEPMTSQTYVPVDTADEGIDLD